MRRAQKLFPNFIAALKADGDDFKAKEGDLVNVRLYSVSRLMAVSILGS